MRSPAEPASSLAFSAALYSVGAEGEKTTVMPGLSFSKAGISFSFQIGTSSLRQLSMVIVVSANAALRQRRFDVASIIKRARIKPPPLQTYPRSHHRLSI